MVVIFSIIQLLFILFIVFSVIAFFTGAPFLPTPSAIVGEMMEVGKIASTDIVSDLGSGDGRLVIAAAKKGARGQGWEINPVLVLVSFINAWRQGVGKRVSIHWGDYRKADLSKTTVVVLYTITGIHTRALSEKCLRELSPGTRILSYQFSLPQFKLKKKTESGIYVYRIDS